MPDHRRVRALPGHRLRLRPVLPRARRVALGDRVARHVEEGDHRLLGPLRRPGGEAHLLGEGRALGEALGRGDHEVQHVAGVDHEVGIARRARQRDRLARRGLRLLPGHPSVEVGEAGEDRRAHRVGVVRGGERLAQERARRLVLRRPLGEVAEADRGLRLGVGAPEETRALERPHERVPPSRAVARHAARVAEGEQRLEAAPGIAPRNVVEGGERLGAVHRGLLEVADPVRALGRAHGAGEGALRVAERDPLEVMVRELRDRALPSGAVERLEGERRAGMEARAAPGDEPRVDRLLEQRVAEAPAGGIVGRALDDAGALGLVEEVEGALARAAPRRPRRGPGGTRVRAPPPPPAALRSRRRAARAGGGSGRRGGRASVTAQRRTRSGRWSSPRSASRRIASRRKSGTPSVRAKSSEVRSGGAALPSTPARSAATSPRERPRSASAPAPAWRRTRARLRSSAGSSGPSRTVATSRIADDGASEPTCSSRRSDAGPAHWRSSSTTRSGPALRRRLERARDGVEEQEAALLGARLRALAGRGVRARGPVAGRRARPPRPRGRAGLRRPGRRPAAAAAPAPTARAPARPRLPARGPPAPARRLLRTRRRSARRGASCRCPAGPRSRARRPARAPPRSTRRAGARAPPRGPPALRPARPACAARRRQPARGLAPIATTSPVKR